MTWKLKQRHVAKNLFYRGRRNEEKNFTSASRIEFHFHRSENQFAIKYLFSVISMHRSRLLLSFNWFSRFKVFRNEKNIFSYILASYLDKCIIVSLFVSPFSTHTACEMTEKSHFPPLSLHFIIFLALIDSQNFNIIDYRMLISQANRPRGIFLRSW